MPMEPPNPLGELLMQSQGSNAGKSAAWDAFNRAKDEDELAAALEKIDLPRETKARLWDLKAGATDPRARETGMAFAENMQRAMPLVPGVAPAARIGMGEGSMGDVGEIALNAALVGLPGAAGAVVRSPAGQGTMRAGGAVIRNLPVVGRMISKGADAFQAGRNEALAARELAAMENAEIQAARQAAPSSVARLAEWFARQKAGQAGAAGAVEAAPSAAPAAAPAESGASNALMEQLRESIVRAKQPPMSRVVTPPPPELVQAGQAIEAKIIELRTQQGLSPAQIAAALREMTSAPGSGFKPLRPSEAKKMVEMVLQRQGVK